MTYPTAPIPEPEVANETSAPSGTEDAPTPAPSGEEQPRKGFVARHRVILGLVAVVVLAAAAWSIINLVAKPSAAPSHQAATSTSPTTQTLPSTTPGESDQPSDVPTPGQTPGASPGASGVPSAAAMNTEVKDGNFSVSATKVQEGVDEVGDGSRTAKPKGQYVLVNLSATNNDSKPHYFYASELVIIDADGAEHVADATALVYLSGAKTLLGEVAAGQSVKGTVVFDLPKGAKPAYLQLPGDPFTKGPTIKLN